MTNWTELKRLAEEAGFSGWDINDLSVTADTRALVCCGRAHFECCGDPDVDGDEFDPICSATSENFAAFIAAANPKTILALIAENSAALDLLAVIHRDGGQHVDNLGFIQSCVLAEQKIFKERSDFETWMDVAKTVDEGAKRLADYAVTLEQERDQLRVEVEALRNDAERYRFLKNEAASSTINALQFAAPGRWDEEVDQAVSEK